MKAKTITTAMLCILILFNSCRAYDKTPIDIAKVSKENVRVKLITTDGRYHSFKRLKEVNGAYYGIVNPKKPKKDIRIFEKDILKLTKLNRKRSRIVTISLISIITGFIVYTLVCAFGCQKI